MPNGKDKVLELDCIRGLLHIVDDAVEQKVQDEMLFEKGSGITLDLRQVFGSFGGTTLKPNANAKEFTSGSSNVRSF